MVNLRVAAALAVLVTAFAAAVATGIAHLSVWLLLGWPAAWVALVALWLTTHPEPPATCRGCGCTDHDCSACVAATGGPCWWIEDDLCSRCAVPAPAT